MKRKMKTKEEILKGTIVATEWDRHDKVTEVSLQTEDDDFVIDLSNAYGKEMFDFLDHEVEVTGIVRQNRHGVKIITVMDFQQIEEEDDFRFDDEDWDTDFGGDEGETPY